LFLVAQHRQTFARPLRHNPESNRFISVDGIHLLRRLAATVRGEVSVWTLLKEAEASER
jgi:hypothetical protein